ncbi:MAG: efflux RND transporter permease subunit [Polyangiaceae bacterium]|nr:efflux RND transporter permease subunit [Myxococcales bacterium]MCB9591061.1 efflux RND transporter permease subunit [Polyangiaceae bacterium]
MNLAEVSIRRPVFAAMLIMALMVFGLISYNKVGVDLYPEVDFPVITVTVVYPGADPETMERNVADKIEESVNTLGGIRSLKSTNLEGVTIVSAEFELEKNGDQALQDVRDKVSRLANELPSGAKSPIVEKFDIGAAPIITMAMAADMPVGKLTDIADNTVKARLQRINGVGSVDIVGGRERQVQILVDPVKLAGLGMTVEDVANAVKAQNIEVPAGSFSKGGAELSVKTKGELNTPQQVADILLVGTGDANLRIRDIAKVVDGVEKATSSSYLDGKPAVSLVVSKQSGSNTVAVAHDVKGAIDELKADLKKQGIELTVPTDNSVYIEHSINDVKFDLFLGALLAVLIILVFLLDWRATLISAIAIPSSVVATFAFIKVMNFTFNNMTMLALSLAIGILVDDAIVVIENIHRHLVMGKKPLQAAKDATSEIFLAVLAMTSTIIAVFFPVAVMKGIVGRFFLQFGLTVSFAVAVSMLVSFTLTPMLSSRFLKEGHGEHRWAIPRAIDNALKWLDRVYGKVIAWSLSHRVITLGLTTVALIFSGFLVTKVPAEFVPAEDRSMFTVKVEAPPGTPLESTTKAVEAVAKDLREHGPGVISTLTTVGGGAQGQINVGEIQVNMTGAKGRKFHQLDLMAWVRERYQNVGDGTKLTVLSISGPGGGQAPVQYAIRGNNLDELVATAEKLKEELAKTKGFVDVAVSYQSGKPELNLEVDRERASALNVPVASVATTIRAFLAGDAVSEMKQGGEAYDIVVKLPTDQETRIEDLSSLKVRSTTGQLVDLSNLVKSERALGPTKIEREARQRQVIVSASLEGLAQGEATKIVNEKADAILPATVHGAMTGNSQMMVESFGYMLEALAIAVILVYMILAAQFDSFIHPITIMVSLPLSVIGAFGGLFISGMTLSIFAMIGVIMLMGLVTKNAILVVDFTEQLRKEGKPMREALIEAGVLRLRPILMTGFAMVFGMLPVALALGEGGEARAPMAVCVIGGLITSTVLTLVVVPVIYTIMEAITHNRFTRFLEGIVFGKTDEVNEVHA